MKPVVSVTTTSGTREKTTISPLSAPCAAPAIRMSSAEQQCLAEAWHARIVRAASTLATAISEPIDRSMPPEITTTACAVAAKRERKRADAPATGRRRRRRRGWIELGDRQDQDGEQGRHAAAAGSQAPGGREPLAVGRRVRRSLSRPPAARPWAARRSVASSASLAGISPTMRPPKSTITRSQTSGISGSSEVNSSTAAPARRQVAQQGVDLALGADVDAAGRVEAEQRPRSRWPASGRSPPSAGCRRRAGAARTPRGCRSAAARSPSSTRARSLRDRDSPQRFIGAEGGSATFSRTERCWQQRLHAVGRHEHQRRGGWRRTGARKRTGSAVALDRAAVGRGSCPASAVEELVLALRLQRGDAERSRRRAARSRRRSSVTPGLSPRPLTASAGGLRPAP